MLSPPPETPVETSAIGFGINTTLFQQMTNLPLTMSLAKALLIVTCVILNFTLCVTSLPAEIERGWRRAVHVLGMSLLSLSLKQKQ